MGDWILAMDMPACASPLLNLSISLVDDKQVQGEMPSPSKLGDKLTSWLTSRCAWSLLLPRPPVLQMLKLKP